MLRRERLASYFERTIRPRSRTLRDRGKRGALACVSLPPHGKGMVPCVDEVGGHGRSHPLASLAREKGRLRSISLLAPRAWLAWLLPPRAIWQSSTAWIHRSRSSAISDSARC